MEHFACQFTTDSAETALAGRLSSGVVISFDGDDTLWDLQVAEASGLRAVAATVPAFGQVSVEAFRKARKAARSPGASMEAIRRDSFARLLADSYGPGEVSEIVDRAWSVFFANRFPPEALFPEVPGTLQAIRDAGFRILLATNGNTRPSDFGLDPVVDACVRAQDIGVAKPDPGFYATAAESMGVETAQIVHVGDHVDDDFRAATVAGCQAVYLDREGLNEDVTPRIRNLVELLPLLGVGTDPEGKGKQ